MSVIHDLIKDVDIPQFFRVTNRMDDTHIDKGRFFHSNLTTDCCLISIWCGQIRTKDLLIPSASLALI